MTLPEPDADSLRTEYQAAETAISSHTFLGWQSTSITAAASLAGVGFLITVNATLALTIATTGAGILFLLILEFARRHLARESFVNARIYSRMREIELALGMRRNIYLNLLANWADHESNPDWTSLPVTEKQSFSARYLTNGQGLPGPKGLTSITTILLVLQASWVLLVIWRWFDYSGVF